MEKKKFMVEKRNSMKDRELLESDMFVDNPEEKMLSKNRRKQILHTTKKIAFHNKESKPKKIIGISGDITERKKAEEELKKVNLDQKKRVLYRTKALTNKNIELRKQISRRKKVEKALYEKTGFIQLLQSVTMAANEASSIEDAMQFCLDKVCEQTGWPVGHVYILSGDSPAMLTSLKIWHLDKANKFETFRKITESTSLPPGIGLPGSVFKSREPAWIIDVTKDKIFQRAKQARNIGVKAAFAFPVMVGKEVMAVLEFFSEKSERPNTPLLKIMGQIGTQLGRVVERKRAELALRRSLDQLSKKSRHENIIRSVTQSIHQSIELQEVLENAANAMRKNIDVVEHVSIFLVEGKEAVMKAYTGHPQWFINRVKRIPYPRGFTWKTIIDGKPIYCADVETDNVIGPAGREVGAKSYASMPLCYEGKTVGSIAVHSFRKNAFDREDLELLGTIAKQLEVAIKNAKQAEAIQESKEKYRTLIEQSNDWVWEVDINGSFTYVNPKVREIIGYEPEELLGKTTFDFMSTDEAKRFSGLLSPFFSRQRPFKRIEKKLVHKEGHEVILEVSGTPMFDSQGFFKGYLGVVEDVTQRRNQEKKIHHFAMHDYMTDLPNRRSLEEELTRITNQNSVKQKGALVMIDLDNFKLINDTLGHLAGDQLLKDLSNALAKIMRPRDLLARMGGDEFAVVLQNVSQKEAKKIVDRLFKSINEFQFNIKGYNLNLNCSIGVTVIDGESSIEEILQNAYSALSQAKTEGKNRISRYGASETIIKIKQATNWKIRIKEALKLDRYTIEFQPVVRLNTEKTEFFEALIRMKADNGQIVFAKSFIHFADRYGLISEIDRWMVEQITHFLASHPSTKLSINLSGSSLRDKSLLSSIERYIREGRISADQLVFEITELSAIRDLCSVQKWMNKLQILNARFALDDFGSGFSSFTHLQTLPVDFVKIDVSFISKIQNDLSCYAIVDSIASVAHALGKDVIAEGVENEEIIKILRELNIEFGQGKIWKSENLDSLRL